MRVIAFHLKMLFFRNLCPLDVKRPLTYSSSINNGKFADDGTVGSFQNADENLGRFGRRRRPKTKIDNTRGWQILMPVDQFAVIPIKSQKDQSFSVGSPQDVLISAARRFLSNAHNTMTRFSLKPNTQEREILIGQEIH